jgi:hypothetical protein
MRAGIVTVPPKFLEKHASRGIPLDAPAAVSSHGQTTPTLAGARAIHRRGRKQAELFSAETVPAAYARPQADRLRDTASATEARISAWWNDLQSSWADHIAKVRQNIDAKKAELDATSAARRADNAEEDALFAIDYAYATIEEAEYALLDAVLARMDADELAAK